MVTPIFQITDYAQAVAFYIDWLGFSIDWQDPAVRGKCYLQISLSNIVLHLTNNTKESSVGARVMAEFTGLLTFHHRLLRKESAFSVLPLQKAAWNNKVMQLELFDPAGNCLVLNEVCG